MHQSGELYIITFPINKLTGDDIYQLMSLSERHEQGEFILNYNKEVTEAILNPDYIVKKAPREKE
jgi:hypothetical protein